MRCRIFDATRVRSVTTAAPAMTSLRSQSSSWPNRTAQTARTAGPRALRWAGLNASAAPVVGGAGSTPGPRKAGGARDLRQWSRWMPRPLGVSASTYLQDSAGNLSRLRRSQSCWKVVAQPARSELASDNSPVTLPAGLAWRMQRVGQWPRSGTLRLGASTIEQKHDPPLISRL